MFLFSTAVLFGMYYANTFFQNPTISANWNYSAVNNTATSLNSLSHLNNGQDPNPALVFGDFLIGVTVLFAVLISGGGITGILAAIPGVDLSVIALVQILYGSSSALLWVYIISFRSV